MGIFHGVKSWALGAEIDELGEEIEVILEMGFDCKGLDLFQFFQRGALG